MATENWPESVFKYCNLRDARRMRDRRSFRVGTFYGYRAFEKENSTVGDVMENTRQMKIENLVASEASPGILKRIRRDGIRFMTGSFGERVNIVTPGQNQFLFSYAFGVNREDLLRWNRETNGRYDCCIEISSFRGFVSALKEGLDSSLKAKSGDRITLATPYLVDYDWTVGDYRDETFHDTVDPCKKRPGYRWQDEGRIIFSRSGPENIEHIDVICHPFGEVKIVMKMRRDGKIVSF